MRHGGGKSCGLELMVFLSFSQTSISKITNSPREKEGEGN